MNIQMFFHVINATVILVALNGETGGQERLQRGDN